MFGILGACWGGSTDSNAEFERAKLVCTSADWKSPDHQSLQIIIKALKQSNQDKNGNVVLNMLLSSFQQSEERKNPAFILKHLFLLENATQQRILLNKISQYYNEKLLYSQRNSIGITSSLKRLITSYYLYIKQKAKIYISQPKSLLDKKTRQKYIQQTSYKDSVTQIQNCFKIQNMIMQINDKYSAGNKNVPLIISIFSSLLKSYLYCYSIVAISLKSFIIKISDMSHKELQSFYKLANFFNKQYARNFLVFIQSNKNMQAFKNIKYNQIVTIDQKILNAINYQLMHQDIQSNSLMVTAPRLLSPIPIRVSTQLVVQKKSFNLKNGETQDEDDVSDQTYNPCTSRYRMNGLVDSVRLLKKQSFSSKSDRQENAFIQYQNLYSNNFILDLSQDINIEDQITKSSLKRKFKVKHKQTIVYCQSEITPQRGSLSKSSKFQKNIWDRWDNIYCN